MKLNQPTTTKIKNFALAAAFATVGIFAPPAAAGDDELGDRIDLSAFPGSLVEDVIVPVPSELFSALDKLGSPNWNVQLRAVKTVRPKDRKDIALRMGAVVAEGFIAVQAQDKKAIQDIGQEVLHLADSLGVKDAIARHSQVIREASEDGNWDDVRTELDKTQETVKSTMEAMKDEHIAQCISIGGWLRGTEAVATVIADSYTEDKAELLNQPDIVEHFLSAIKEMPKTDNLKKISKGLAKVWLAMGDGTKPVDVNATKAIRDTVQKLAKLSEK